MKTVRSASVSEWDDIWQHCPYATFFHSREWAEIWSVYTKGHVKPDSKLIEFNDGKKVLLPLSSQKRLKGLSKSYLSSPAGTFGGWIAAESLDQAHADRLVDYLMKDLPGIVWRWNPYDPHLFKTGIRAGRQEVTHALNLETDLQELTKRRSKGNISSMHKAVKSGVQIMQAQNIDDWREYFAVYEDSIQRWGESVSSRYTYDLFDEIFKRKSAYIRLWLARSEAKVIAGALMFYAKQHAVYWHGAALSDYFEMRPVNLLMDACIKDAGQRNLTWFDFNPSGGHEGVAAFKKRFGADELPCPVIHTETKLLKVVAKIKRKMRAIRKT